MRSGWNFSLIPHSCLQGRRDKKEASRILTFSEAEAVKNKNQGKCNKKIPREPAERLYEDGFLFGQLSSQIDWLAFVCFDPCDNPRIKEGNRAVGQVRGQAAKAQYGSPALGRGLFVEVTAGQVTHALHGSIEQGGGQNPPKRKGMPDPEQSGGKEGADQKEVVFR